MLYHLLKFDYVHLKLQQEVKVNGSNIVIDGKEIKVLSERDPADLGGGDLDVEDVIESTGRFTQRDDAQKHIDAGEQKVIISAPAKEEDLTMEMGVNEQDDDPNKHDIV